MEETWTDQLSAWSTLATAGFTLVLAVLASMAWGTARSTLLASKRASEAAEAANDQARRDSMERTRPFVYVDIIPGLAGSGHYDIKIWNSGRSAARAVTLDYDSWPQPEDDVTARVRTLFETPRTIPPRSAVRSMWRLTGNFSDGTTVAGLPTTGRITANYTSDDPSQPHYTDYFDVLVDSAGLWPVPEAGPNPDGLHGDSLKFYNLGQALVRRLGELGR